MNNRPGNYICQRQHCMWRKGNICIRTPCPYGACIRRVEQDDRGKTGTVPGVKV